MNRTHLLLFLCLAGFLACSPVLGAKNVAYIYGDVAADGTIPSGAAAPFHQMLLTDTGNRGCSEFKAMVEAEGYTIAQYYDRTNTLNAAFLDQFDVIVFGLHQKVWSAGEQAALDAWLQAGGGIMMYSDSAAGGHYNQAPGGIKNPVGQTAVNAILSNYGMQVAVDQGGGTRAYTPITNSANPIVWGEPIFEGEGVSPVAIDQAGDAVALYPFDDAYKVSGSSISIDARNITISNPEWAVIAYCPVGEGNIIATFDRQPMWNDGEGSDIDRRDNREILRRLIRYLARDYGNSSEWLDLVLTNGLELTYRQWSGGAGTVGYDYTARNNRFSVQQRPNFLIDAWAINSNWIEEVSTAPEAGGETEIATVRLLPIHPASFERIAVFPATATVPDVVRAINCGGTAYTGSDGINYQADNYYVGGHTDSFPGNAVANTADDLLYNYARSNFSAYNIPVSNGDYTVHLKFAETFWTAAGKRVFDMWIEGVLILHDLDICAAAPGKWVALDLEFSVTVNDGTLSITAASSVNNSLLNAIVVIQE